MLPWSSSARNVNLKANGIFWCYLDDRGGKSITLRYLDIVYKYVFVLFLTKAFSDGKCMPNQQTTDLLYLFSKCH